MKEVPWIDWRDTPSKGAPMFRPSAVVQVEYRDGRIRQGAMPWMFAGWHHTGGRCDIVKYREVVK